MFGGTRIENAPNGLFYGEKKMLVHIVFMEQN